jgi:hypothetical protein
MFVLNQKRFIGRDGMCETGGRSANRIPMSGTVSEGQDLTSVHGDGSTTTRQGLGSGKVT